MRVALVFLAGMAIVAGFNKHARSLERRSLQVMPATTAEEFAAFKERWRANHRVAEESQNEAAAAVAVVNP